MTGQIGDFSHRQPDRRVLADNLFAVRSDQVRFWYYQEQQVTLSRVSLTLFISVGI